MIGHFPTPYPDELLYSICARFCDRVRYPAVASVNLELFGSRHFVAPVDLPSHIDALTSRLPPGCRLTSKRIIDENTLLPFYSPFLLRERVDRIREAMKSTDGTAIGKISGVTSSIIRPPERLQFCPACVVEDRRKSGETYWHRLHQIPGVKVCPVHNSILETSNIRARTFSEYIPAEHAVSDTPPQLIDVNDLLFQVLLRISHDADWLLKQRSLVPGFAELREQYVYLLMEKGLASFNCGHVAGPKLLEALQEYYSTSILNSLDCGFDSQQFNKWPLVFVKDLNINKAHHPLRHLLIIQLLGHKPESFFNFIKPEYFGKGPWPCANRVCDFYLKPSIKTCQIKRANTSKGGKLVGVFECDCGYTYTREVLDSGGANSFTVRSVTRFGPIWEAALRQLWKDKTVSLEEIARRLLGMKRIWKLQLEAARIGLPLPRKGPHESSCATSSSRLGTQPKTRSGRTISESRKKWKEILARHPEAVRTHLRTNYRPLYRWLENNDTEWLKKHLPPPAPPANRRVVDWAKRDLEIAKTIKPLVIKLKECSARPIRITICLIGSKLGCRELFLNQRQKLPLTDQALAKVVETRVEFALRRLRWAANCFLQENRHPSRSGLLLRACFGSELWDNPTIKSALESTWQSLQNQEIMHVTKVA